MLDRRTAAPSVVRQLDSALTSLVAESAGSAISRITPTSQRLGAQMSALENVDNRRWFTVPEAASILGMSRQTMWRRVRCGELTVMKVDEQMVIPASRLTDLLASGTIRARAYRTRARPGASSD